MDIPQGSKRVHVIIQNTTDDIIELPAKTLVCNLSLANLVPKLIADPKDFTVGDINQSFIQEDFSFLGSEDILNTTQLFPNGKILDKTLSHLLDATKPAPIINHQVNINQDKGSSTPTTSDASWLFDILDLSGIQDWSTEPGRWHNGSAFVFCLCDRTFETEPSPTSAHACGEVTGCAPAAKRSASVAPEVNLGECTLHSPPQK